MEISGILAEMNRSVFAPVAGLDKVITRGISMGVHQHPADDSWINADASAARPFV